MKVLLVDHDPRSIRILKRVLKEDYIVESAPNATDAEELFYNNHYDIVIIELMLPDMDGEDLITILKTHVKDLPIIVISSRSSVHDKSLAFERGADDYLVKPVNSVELKARMKAKLRRRNDFNEKIHLKILQVRELRLDRIRRVVSYKEDRIKLRKKEVLLLEYFMMNRGRVLTRGDILESVWASSVNPFTNTVDVHIKRLRDKIEKPYKESYIETVHGMGYLFE